MKRSEANEILKLRVAFSTQYDCFSVKEIDGESVESSFNHNGCECCNSLACDTIEVTCLEQADIAKKRFDNIIEVDICNGCLCFLANGDDTDLDYHATEEDCGAV